MEGWLLLREAKTVECNMYFTGLGAVHYCILQCSKVLYIAVQYSTVYCSAVQYCILQCSTLLSIAVQYYTVYCVAVQYCKFQCSVEEQSTFKQNKMHFTLYSTRYVRGKKWNLHLVQPKG